MTIYARPENTTIWAESGNISLPTTEKQEQGWVTEKPPSEMMNWVHNKQDKSIAYLLQEGISEWDAETEYTIGAFVKESGVLYQAKLQNLNKLPSTNASNWGIAFDSKGSALAVQTDLNLIKNNDGQLPYYVRKASPVMTAKAVGTSFEALFGVPVNNQSNFGHSFVNDGDSGLFKDGDIVKIYNDSQLVANFPTSIPAADSSKSVATTEWVTNFLNNSIATALEALRIPIGASLITNKSENPFTYLNYGTWVQDVQGKALIGVSSSPSPSIPNWTKFVDQEYGEYEKTLTEDNLPAHKHKINWKPIAGKNIDVGNTDQIGFSGDDAADLSGFGDTASAGAGQAFDIVQPSQTKYIWTRTA